MGMTQQHPTIGSLLRALRARNDWTLKEMSQRCGIPLSTWSKVENDRLSLTYDKLQFDPDKDLIPVAHLADTPLVATTSAARAREATWA